MRAVILDACQIIYLTSDEKNKEPARRLKEYFRQITLGEKNGFPSDKKREEKVLERTQQYFAKP